ncbi:zinc finger, C2H2 type [Necator americanus]|uniref:Zinc finger, C2H2 type n=1 Tax=Necator americanus TaxID=51031 RepID=W2TWW4_NECAM|nr:zinc finger, C2H2 type [Necator americanus]ETN85561.1 zinc finger, C2H2 type [Necator americanus]
MQLDACSIKSEPCDDDVKSVCPSGELKLDCQFCGTSFESISELQTHTLRDHLPVPVPSLECQHCCAVLPSFAAFVLHMRGHLSDRDESKCPRCPLSFSDAQARLSHVISHFEVRKPLRFCMECGVSFSDSLSLGQHFMELHLKLQHLCTVCGQSCETQKEFTVPRSDACAACQAPLLTAEDFEKHTRMHTADLYMHCAVCRQSIRSETQLSLHCQFHMERRTDGEDSEQTCGICGKVLVNRYQLNVHLMEHDERRCCPHCLRPFALAQHLLTHVSEEHGEDQPLHSCEICEENFRFAVQLENHVLKHAAETKSRSNSNTPSPTELFPCQQCSMVFSSPSALLSHSRSHTESQRRCPLCGLSFNTASRFENHVRKHASTTNCVCQICGDGFASRDVLDLHMQVHKGNLELGAHNLLS